MSRTTPTAEDRLESGLWGCFILAAIITLILVAGGFVIIRWVLA